MISADLHPVLKKLVRELSEELDLDDYIVEDMIKSEFSFVTKKIREYNVTGEDAPILLNYLGKFVVKSNRRLHLQIYKAENDNREQQLSTKGDTDI